MIFIYPEVEIPSNENDISLTEKLRKIFMSGVMLGFLEYFSSFKRKSTAPFRSLGFRTSKQRLGLAADVARSSVFFAVIDSLCKHDSCIHVLLLCFFFRGFFVKNLRTNSYPC